MEKTLLEQYQYYKSLNLNIDMSRGKPSREQLSLSFPMLDVLNSKTAFNIDYCNYGTIDGIKECKALFAEILDVPANNVIVFGNSSIKIMYDLIAISFIKGIAGQLPFSKQEKIKWLCPVPGYDRHFAMLEYFGIEMINIPMDEYGPDMDKIEEYIKDPAVKGVWCVPKYSNPSGIIYSDEVVRRFARLKPAAKDFRVFWDNTYLTQLSFEGKEEPLLNIYTECQKAQNEDIVYVFTSFSKVTFPGSAVIALAASDDNVAFIKDSLKYQTIGYDKVNELRHVLFLKDKNHIYELTKKHAAIMKKKFDLVLSIFDKEIKDLVDYTRPTGGYFISLYAPNKANEIVDKCQELGVKLTPVGSAYPYHHDPDNAHIRIAPTFLGLDDLEVATKIICLAVKLIYK